MTASANAGAYSTRSVFENDRGSVAFFDFIFDFTFDCARDTERDTETAPSRRPKRQTLRENSKRKHYDFADVTTPIFVPPRRELRMQIRSRNNVLFELRGSGQFVTLFVWCNGAWRRRNQRRREERVIVRVA